MARSISDSAIISSSPVTCVILVGLDMLVVYTLIVHGRELSHD
jgi:hypothetical protein